MDIFSIEAASSSDNECKHFGEKLSSSCIAVEIIVGLIIFFAVVGLVTNCHIIWFYGSYKKLEKSSHKLFYALGVLDFCTCVLTIACSAGLFIGNTKTTCILNSIVHILRTRVALYVFAFLSVARFYVTCIRADNTSILSFLPTKIAIALFSLFTCFDLGIRIDVLCFAYNTTGVLQVHSINEKAASDNPRWQLTVATYLQYFSWDFQVLLTFAVLVFYFLIWRSLQNDDRRQFRFNDPEFDSVNESVVTRIFRLQAVFGLIFMCPQLVVQIVIYYDPETVLGFRWAEWSALFLYSSYMLNLFMFEYTPLIYAYVDHEFRLTIEQKWKSIYKEIRCGKRTQRSERSPSINE